MFRFLTFLTAASLLLLVAQAQQPTVHGEYYGEPMYTVLPPGAIKEINKAEFVTGSEAAAQMSADEPVVALQLGNETRAYSLWQLDSHEVVNDAHNSISFIVSWCPLCHSTRVYDRVVNGRTLNFIVSGKLWKNTLVLQDRETGSLWSQLTGEALDGSLKGARLKPIPAVHSVWQKWVERHPETRVLKKSQEVKSSKYEAYFRDPNRVGIFRSNWLTKRMPGKTLVYGIALGSHAAAMTVERLNAEGVMNLRLGEQPVVVVAAVDGGRAYLSILDTKPLSFRQDKKTGEVRDVDTGSLWNLEQGVAVEGSLKGKKLSALPLTSTYWFAWSSYFPNTQALD